MHRYSCNVTVYIPTDRSVELKRQTFSAQATEYNSLGTLHDSNTARFCMSCTLQPVQDNIMSIWTFAICRWPVYYFWHRRQLTKAVYLLYNIFKEYNLETATKRTKVFGFVGTYYLRTKIIINDETLEQVSQFTYLGCSISYQFSNDVQFKLAKFLTINRYY